jgi:hypothetical protein
VGFDFSSDELSDQIFGFADWSYGNQPTSGVVGDNVTITADVATSTSIEGTIQGS